MRGEGGKRDCITAVLQPDYRRQWCAVICRVTHSSAACVIVCLDYFSCVYVLSLSLYGVAGCSCMNDTFPLLVFFFFLASLFKTQNDTLPIVSSEFKSSSKTEIWLWSLCALRSAERLVVAGPPWAGEGEGHVRWSSSEVLFSPSLCGSEESSTGPIINKMRGGKQQQAG